MRLRTPTGSASRSAPATVALPDVGRSSVVSMRSVVVLPAPLGPRKPTISPSATARSTPRTASTVRLRLRNVRVSPFASMIVMTCPVSSRCLITVRFARARRAPPARSRPGRPCVIGEALAGRQGGQDLGELVVPAHLGLGVHLAAVHHRRLHRAQVSLGHQALPRSEEHTSELQSRPHLVCRLLLEKKK